MTRTLTPELIARLQTILGPEGVVTEEETLRIYGQDETEDLLFVPEVIVKPSTTAQVSEIMRLATGMASPASPCGYPLPS